MIYSPPQHVELRYRPSYSEIADDNICLRYYNTEKELLRSREGSEFIRKTIAQIELETRMKRLAALKDNWDTFGTEHPSELAVALASALVRKFVDFGLVPDAIVPSTEGGVAICFLRNQKYADVECLNSGDILAVRYSSEDEPRAWSIQSDAADATIETFSQYLSV